MEPSVDISRACGREPLLAIKSPLMLRINAGVSLLALLLATYSPGQEQPRQDPATQEQPKAGKDVVQNAILVNRVAPEYKASWKKEGLQGTVHLSMTIAKDGSVRDLRVVDGDSLLAKSALKAVRQWRYKPALKNGEPVEVQSTIAVVFALNAAH